MNKFHSKRLGAYGLALVLFLYLSSCQEDDPTPAELLRGEWELDGLPTNDPFSGSFDPWFWVFEEDGDFLWKLSATGGGYGLFLQGEWELNNAQDEITIEVDLGSGNVIDVEVDIDLLTSEVLEVDGVITYGSDFDVTLEFEKID